jgi:L-lactate dehydrogenase complex protein LldG
MTSRDQLLARVRKNKPDLLPLPEVPTFENPADDLHDRFRDALAFVGGKLLEVFPTVSISDYITATFPDAQHIVSSIPLPELSLTTIDKETDKVLLEKVDVAVLRGEFVVAENGSVWVPEPNMLHRALPFITQHLILVVEKSKLVPNMHVAYKHVDRSTLTYGTFICGPSKTADIEQSLVVGAHGPRSLTIALMMDS